MQILGVIRIYGSAEAVPEQREIFTAPQPVLDLDPGSAAYLTPGFGMGKISGSGMNNPHHISQSLEAIFNS
jgi:hypothetical protein